MKRMILLALMPVMLIGIGIVAQPTIGPVDHLRLAATGQATATLHAGGTVLDLTSIINHEHPAGWTGEGTIVVQAIGAGASCRIVADGVVVAEDAGPVATCRYP